MLKDEFGSLLSQLNDIVEQLEKAHDKQVEEALWCAGLRAGEQEEEDIPQEVHIVKKPGTTLASEFLRWSSDPLKERGCIDGKEVGGDVFRNIGVPDDNRRGSNSGSDVTDQLHLGENMNVPRAPRALSAERIRGSDSEMKHNISTMSTKSLKLFQFWIRRPWCDYHEFEALRLSSDLRCLKGKTKFSTRISQMLGKTSSLDIEMTTGVFGRQMVAHPDSACRTLWIFACMAFLIYDVIMVPVEVCFALEGTSDVSRLTNLSATIFWTLDILFNFLTGVRHGGILEMRPVQVARIYARSYLLFDVCLVLPEWIRMFFPDVEADAIAVLRIGRWGRLSRLLRVARIMKIMKFRPVLRSLIVRYHLSSAYLQITQGWVGLFLVYIVLLHALCCMWYAFGSALGEWGWVCVNDLESASVFHAYVVSLRWSMSRLCGIGVNYRLETEGEMMTDLCLMYVGLTCMCFYLGKVTAACIKRADSKLVTLWLYASAFSQRHAISPELDSRLVKVLETLHAGGAGEVEDQEAILLQALPMSLQEDLLFEARVCHLLIKPFFNDMASLNERVVRHVTIKAVTSRIAVQREVLFAFGDACHAVLFVTSGTLWYAYNVSPAEVLDDNEEVMSVVETRTDGAESVFETMMTSKMTRSPSTQTVGNKSTVPSRVDLRGLEFLPHTTMIQSKWVVSEPVLWTVWEHSGSLLAAEESVALSLDPVKFSEVVCHHAGPCMHMVKYAKHFVWMLNHAPEVNDLTEFPELTMDRLDEEMIEGTAEDHFIFMSHYKVEAGTEATLIRDSLLPILKEDLRHCANNFRTPIFIDSEDLIDLTRLKEHVEKSISLVLLLTPDVLSRPWCLIEIVTAVRSKVNLVPVEVQRDGCEYQYPTEDYYSALIAGESLNEASVGILEQEGISLWDVEQAIRQVFLKIASPFSPHKTKAVREAELRDIFKRCNENLEQAGPISNPSYCKSRSRTFSVEFSEQHSVRSV